MGIKILHYSGFLYVLKTLKGKLSRVSQANWMSEVFCCTFTCVNTEIIYHGKYNEAITVITERENDSSLEWRCSTSCEINPS